MAIIFHLEYIVLLCEYENLFMHLIVGFLKINSRIEINQISKDMSS
jgi:hypothetical protein